MIEDGWDGWGGASQVSNAIRSHHVASLTETESGAVGHAKFLPLDEHHVRPIGRPRYPQMVGVAGVAV